MGCISIASHLRIFIVASFKFCSQKFCVFVNMSAWRRMYTAAEAVAMLEDASECDLALSDLDVQVIFILKLIVNLSVSENIIKQVVRGLHVMSSFRPKTTVSGLPIVYNCVCSSWYHFLR